MNEYTMQQIEIGMKESFFKKISRDMEEKFRFISGDENPLHRDNQFAIEISCGKFKSHVTFGMLTASLYSTMVGVYLPGRYSLIHSIENISFRHPVYVGDELLVIGEVINKEENLNLVRLKVVIYNQEQHIVSTAYIKVLVLKPA